MQGAFERHLPATADAVPWKAGDSCPVCGGAVPRGEMTRRWD